LVRSWLLRGHGEAPVSGSMILAGNLFMFDFYESLRFFFQFKLNSLVSALCWFLLVGLCWVSFLYGSLMSSQWFLTFMFFFIKWGGAYVTRYCGHFWPIVQPQMIDEGDCGAIGGMKIGRGNQSTRRKPAPAPFCSPQIPLDQTRARTRAAAVGSQRLTAWAMARPLLSCCSDGHSYQWNDDSELSSYRIIQYHRK
jgi:hypothetical protein